MVRLILRLEGLVFFLLAVYLYYLFKGEWFLFVLLFLAPDISAIGYIKNRKLGSITYNLFHNYILSLVILGMGYFVFNNLIIIYLGIILFAHVSLDRFFGYGLKYKNSFKETHLQKI